MNTKQHHLLVRTAKGLATLLILLASTAALAAPVGFVTSIEGIAQVQAANTSNWQPAAVNGEVSVGDSVRTERGAEVEIRLVDDTVLTVYEETDLFIDRMIVGDLATKERSILREMQGRVRAKVGNAFGGTTRLEIHTPTAIVGVRGSTMDVAFNAATGTTTASIVAGTGFVTANGQTVELNAGEQSVIPQGQSPGSPEPAETNTGGGEPEQETTEASDSNEASEVAQTETTAANGEGTDQQTAAAGESGMGAAPDQSGFDAPASADMDIDDLLFGEGGVGAETGEFAVGQTETVVLEQQTLNQSDDVIQTDGDSQRVTTTEPTITEPVVIDPESDLGINAPTLDIRIIIDPKPEP